MKADEPESGSPGDAASGIATTPAGRADGDHGQPPSPDRFDEALVAGLGRLALFMLALIAVSALSAGLTLHFQGRSFDELTRPASVGVRSPDAQ